MKRYKMEIENLKFDENGLIPAIIQDAETRTVLMLGYMNREALTLTLTNGKVCFFSRSRQKLWTKGEESGHFLYLKDIQADCDGDTLLVKAKPLGPTCHTGTDTCWGEKNEEADFLFFLQKFLQKRKNDSPEESYTARLISKGINKIAQKVGEEAVELVIEAKEDVYKRQGQAILLDANENPFDTGVNRYPDPYQRELKK